MAEQEPTDQHDTDDEAASDSSDGQVSELASRGPDGGVGAEPGSADEVPPAEDAKTEPGAGMRDYGE